MTSNGISRFVLPPPKVSSLGVTGTDLRFPIRRVYGIGRNYSQPHENSPSCAEKTPPLVFQRNPDQVIGDARYFPYPDATQDVLYEVELVVALRAGGRNIPCSEALDLVFGYCVGLDMTRLDLHAQAKRVGGPWEIAKAFEHSAPCGQIVQTSEAIDFEDAVISLQVNGEYRQQARLGQMIWRVDKLISYLSTLFELAAGDLIMTGSPPNAGSVRIGDMLHAHIDGLEDLAVRVVPHIQTTPS